MCCAQACPLAAANMSAGTLPHMILGAPLPALKMCALYKDEAPDLMPKGGTLRA